MATRNEIVAAIREVEDTTAVLATGARPQSLKDLLVMGDLNREEYLQILHDSFSQQNIPSYRCDDALVTNSPRMGIAYYNHDAFLQTIDSLTSGDSIDPIVKPWSTGPWLPEAFADDLRRAIPLSDGSAVLDLLRTFDEYPPNLREAICARCILEIQIKSRQIEGTTLGLGKETLAADICFAGLRYLHAKEGQYFRGIRYLEDTLPTLPDESQTIARELAASSNNYFLARSID